MPMDLAEIQKQLDSLQKKPKQQKREKVDYKKFYWKPTVGEHYVRVVPSKFDSKTPFRTVYFHYDVTRAPIIALNNFGEKDPIQEFANQLKESGDPGSYKMAGKLFPKMRVFAPVIVRGEEEAGVRLWEFGKQTYQDFLNLAMDEEVGDFTDIVSGRDVKVTTVGPEVTGTSYNKSSIMPRMKTSPLSEDESVAKAWLEEQPDIFALYKRYTFDELKEAFSKKLESMGDEEAEESTPSNSNANEGSYSVSNVAEKETKNDKFNKLFNEDK